MYLSACFIFLCIWKKLGNHWIPHTGNHTVVCVAAPDSFPKLVTIKYLLYGLSHPLVSHRVPFTKYWTMRAATYGCQKSSRSRETHYKIQTKGHSPLVVFEYPTRWPYALPCLVAYGYLESNQLTHTHMYCRNIHTHKTYAKCVLAPSSNKHKTSRQIRRPNDNLRPYIKAMAYVHPFIVFHQNVSPCMWVCSHVWVVDLGSLICELTYFHKRLQPLMSGRITFTAQCYIKAGTHVSISLHWNWR